MCDGMIFFIFEVYEAFLELFFRSEFAFDEFGVGADDIFYLFL